MTFHLLLDLDVPSHLWCCIEIIRVSFLICFLITLAIISLLSKFVYPAAERSQRAWNIQPQPDIPPTDAVDLVQARRRQSMGRERRGRFVHVWYVYASSSFVSKCMLHCHLLLTEINTHPQVIIVCIEAQWSAKTSLGWVPCKGPALVMQTVLSTRLWCEAWQCERSCMLSTGLPGDLMASKTLCAITVPDRFNTLQQQQQ